MTERFNLSQPTFVSREEKRLIRRHYSNTAWALIVCEVMMNIFATLMITAFSLTGYRTVTNTAGETVLDPVLIMFSYTSVTFALICTFLMFGRVFRFKMRDCFSVTKVTVKKVMLTVVISLGVANCAYVINIFLRNYMYANGYDLKGGYGAPETGVTIAADIISSSLIAPIFEEIFYRGLIMRSLCAVSKRFAIIASAVIFGLIHGNPIQFLLGFMAGIVFAYADIKMDSILPSIAAHIAINSHLYIYDLVPEAYGDIVYLACVGVFIAAGAAALIYTVKKYGTALPEYTYYHRQRTLPILVRSLPAWIFLLYSLYSMTTSLERV